MSQDLDKLQPPQQSEYGTYKSYFLGFGISLLLTLIAFFLATRSSIQGWRLDLLIGSLAAVQSLVYLFFFLHLKDTSKPRWNLLTLLFTIMVVFIVIFGSIWIMNNLMYNLM
jgi:cytochrome o ubiquinol oxidase operon protein cyoD